MDEPRLIDLQAGFLAEAAARSPATRKSYRTALGVFAAFLAETRGLRWDADGPGRLDPQVLSDFYLSIVETRGRERRSTADTYTSGATAFVRFLARTGRLPADASLERMREHLRAVRQSQPYRSPRIDGRLPLLVAHVMSLPVPVAKERRGQKRLEVLRDQALVLLLYASGVRRQEAARANRADCDDGQADRLLVFGKGDRERVAFLDGDTQAAIQAYLAARGDAHRPLFLRHDNHRGPPGRSGERWRLAPGAIWAIVKRHAKAAGIPASTHHLRHLKASTLLNNGAALDQVQDLLGHASPATTKKVYAHYESARLREVFDRCSVTASEAAARVGKDLVGGDA